MPLIDLPQKLGRGDATRQRIIEQSAPIFNQHGYAGTSISRLMVATGLEKGGIYRHFESKQELAAAAFDYAWECVSTPRQQGLVECPSYLAKLLLFVRNFIEESPGNLPGGCPLLNTAVDSDDGDPLLRKKARTALAGWRSQLAQLFRLGQAAGEFEAETDADSVAVVIIATLEGSIMMGRLEKSREPLRIAGNYLMSYLKALGR